MSRMRIVAVALLLALLISIGFIGGIVAAFNPQPEPPGAQANKFQAMVKQLQGIHVQLDRWIPESESVAESNVYNALLALRAEAQAIVDHIDTIYFRPRP